ncbi:MAG: ROK family protein, partial [Verrucomicrobiales bacterium]
AIRGAGAGANPVFYVTMGSGVGGGLVVDKRIYHGAIPGEAEMGHIRLDKTGRIVEESCSGWAVDKKIREAIKQDAKSKLAQFVGNSTSGESRHLSRALAEGDPLAHKILAETADDMAFGLSHVTHLIHPETIVLGGGLSLVGEPIRAAVQEALPRYTMHAFHPVPKVTLAALGEDVVPVGALLLGAQSVSA